MKQLYLNRKELATRWRVSERSVTNYRKSGKIQALQLPNSSRYIFLLTSIEEYERDFLTGPKRFTYDVESLITPDYLKGVN